MDAAVEKLIELHESDITSKDKSSVELCEHIKSLGSFAIDENGKGFKYLSESTQLCSELISIIIGHPNIVVIGEALRLVCDLTDPQLYQGEDRTDALSMIDKFLDSDFPRELNLLMLQKQDILLDAFRFFDNICEIYPTAGPSHLVERTAILESLRRIVSTSTEQKFEIEENLLASDLLSVLVIASESAREIVSEKKYLESLLQVVAIWKSKDPEFAEEQEWCENIHSIIRSCLLNRPAAHEIFAELEGIELFLKLRGRITLLLGLKTLHIVTSHHANMCRRVVQCGGLKILFPVLSGTRHKDKKVKTDGSSSLFTDVVIESVAILANLCLYLQPEEIESQRIVLKCKEEGKVQRLVALMREASSRVSARVAELEEEDDEDESSVDSEEDYLDLLEHGLEDLQRVAIILAKLHFVVDEELKTILKNELSELDTINMMRVLIDFAEKIIVLSAGEVDNDKTLVAKAKLFLLSNFLHDDCM